MKKDNVIQFPKEKRYPVNSENANFTIQVSDITLADGLDALEISNFDMEIDTEQTIMIAFDLKNEMDKE